MVNGQVERTLGNTIGNEVFVRSGENVDTIAHEMWHAYQWQQGGFTFARNYWTANTNAGYWANPFEVAAREFGEYAFYWWVP
jgi:hypothetical protein